MRPEDVASVVAVQEPGAVRGLAQVFPQDAYPFPRRDVALRWLREIRAPGTECYVVLAGGAVTGFAATRDDELLHFGVAVEHWGTGLARTAHDELLERMATAGVRRAWLTVFTQNPRGRRFYEGLGWRPTGAVTHSSVPPHPELQRYERDLTGPAEDGPEARSP
jgi:RimJ/RimL family protein N-acetyltransferase